MAINIARRKVVSALGGVAVTWLLAARAAARTGTARRCHARYAAFLQGKVPLFAIFVAISGSPSAPDALRSALNKVADLVSWLKGPAKCSPSERRLPLRFWRSSSLWLRF